MAIFVELVVADPFFYDLLFNNYEFIIKMTKKIVRINYKIIYLF